MTWVVGMPSMFGYCVGIADVQATISYPTGKKLYIDSVQKIFPVGKFIAAGFCGDIQVGFLLINDLQNWAVLPEKGVAWIPDCLVSKWRRRARRIFSLIKGNAERKVEILLLGVYPQRENGIPGQAQTYGCIMRSPEFDPECFNPGKIAAIGSGNEVEMYVEAIERINKEGYTPLMQMEVGNPGGYGLALSSYLSLKVNENPVHGISNHFHICYVKRGVITIGPNDYSIYPNQGSKIDIVMPTVATNWTEFKHLMKRKGISMAKAYAIA